MYIVKQVWWSVLLVLLVLLSLDSLSRVIEQSDSIREKYNFLQLLYYIALTLPGRAVIYMPYAGLVGTLVGMGVLANNNELIVMRSAGLSMWRLIAICLIPIVFLMLFAMATSEFVVPKLDRFAEKNRLQQRYVRSGGFLTKRKFWNRENNEFMRIDSLSNDSVIYGLTRYRFNKELELESTLYASSAEYVDDHWLMHDIKETQFTSLNTRLTVKHYDSSVWKTDIKPYNLEYLLFDPEDLSIARIYQFSKYLEAQNLNAESYHLVFWSKVLYPLTAISLILVVISGIFGSLRQMSIGYRVFVGVVIGVVFRMGQNSLTPIAMVYDLSPFIASFLPIAICIIIGFFRLRRVY